MVAVAENLLARSHSTLTEHTENTRLNRAGVPLTIVAHLSSTGVASSRPTHVSATLIKRLTKGQ